MRFEGYELRLAREAIKEAAKREDAQALNTDSDYHKLFQAIQIHECEIEGVVDVPAYNYDVGVLQGND